MSDILNIAISKAASVTDSLPSLRATSDQITLAFDDVIPTLLAPKPLDPKTSSAYNLGKLKGRSGSIDSFIRGFEEIIKHDTSPQAKLLVSLLASSVKQILEGLKLINTTLTDEMFQAYLYGFVGSMYNKNTTKNG